MNQVFKKILTILIPFFLLFTAFVPVLAQEDEVESTERPERTTTVNERRQQAQDRLTANRLRVCEVKKTSIQNKLDRLTDFFQNMIEKFDAIASRVMEFYITTAEPAGHVVENYDELVAAIGDKKAAAQDALDSINTSDIANFDCEGDNPKALLEDFRLGMQEVKSALHEYRTAIKNLIVAIRTTYSNDGGEETTE